MNLIISLVLVFIFIYVFKNQLKKNAGVFYIISMIVAVFVSCTLWTASYLEYPELIKKYFVYLFTKAAFPTALFIVIMYIGILPRKSKLFKSLMPLRAELSIIASILTLGHNIGYGRRYFIALFTNGKIPANFYYASIVSLIMIAIMLPLFITSFKTVRKKMKGLNWKKLHTLAYVFYALIWVHIILIYYTTAYKGSVSTMLTIAVYTIIFVFYAYSRIQKAIVDRKKNQYVLPLSKGLAIAIVVSVLVLSPSVKHKYIDRDTQTCGDNMIKDLNVRSDNTGSTEDRNENNQPTPDSESDPDPEKLVYKDGEYEGSAYGYVDEIVVKVTVKEGIISNIEILSESEDVEYMVYAVDVINQMIKENSTDVDAISGSTTSSEAIIKAVKKALEDAI